MQSHVQEWPSGILLALWRKGLDSRLMKAKAEPRGGALADFIHYTRPYALGVEKGEKMNPFKPRLSLLHGETSEKAELFTKTWTNQFFVQLLSEGAGGAEKLKSLAQSACCIGVR